MVIFNWLAALIVILSLVYVSFVLTLAEWLAALRAGQAVPLLPESRGAHLADVDTGRSGSGGVGAFRRRWLLCCGYPLFAIPAGASFVLKAMGLILYLAGCVFVLWARRTLGKMWGSEHQPECATAR